MGLSNVLSGTPITFKPFVVSAKYAAEYRNYWWTEVREAKGDRGIKTPERVTPYPSKSDQTTDRPESDRGGNFGRLARTGLMDDYISEIMALPLSGIPVKEWTGFLRRFRQ